MYINIIPKDWGISRSEMPEKWLFALAGDDTVIMAQPLGLDHDNFPVVVCAPDFDGYSLTPISRMELISGLQGVLSFLFSSHVANVRKSINDSLIVDPYLVNMTDFEKSGPGRLIRLRRTAWGKGVENAVKQLAVTDVTEMMKSSSAAVDSLQGIMRKGGERRSAQEARDTRMSALSRLARMAKVASTMTLYDLGYLISSQTLQLMTSSVYVSTMGRHQSELREEYGLPEGVEVEPSKLNVRYNVQIHDGTVELGEHAETWVQIFQTLSSQPAIGQGFDMVRIFKHLARMLGAKNLNSFVQKGGNVSIKYAQDALIQSELQKGNVRAIGQGGANGEATSVGEGTGV
jgi:hypothetical protein